MTKSAWVKAASSVAPGQPAAGTCVLGADKGHLVGVGFQPDEATLPVHGLPCVRVEGIEPAWEPGGEGRVHRCECRDTRPPAQALRPPPHFTRPPLSTREPTSRAHGNRWCSNTTRHLGNRGHRLRPPGASRLLPVPGHTPWNLLTTGHSAGLICVCRTEAFPL